MASPEDDSQRKKLEDLKIQKKTYRYEKKRVAQELVSALKDPTVVVMADWLKIRGTLRKWSRFYCVLKPGILLIYKGQKTHKHGYWIGTVLLNSCELIERPSKKDGFCFKLFHPLDQSIWATRGPRGESLGAVTQPLPGSHLICRAPSEDAGRCWMDALELSLRCSGLLMRTMHKLNDSTSSTLSANKARTGSFGEQQFASSHEDLHGLDSSRPSRSGTNDSEELEKSMKAPIAVMDESDAEKHFQVEGTEEEEEIESDSEPEPSQDMGEETRYVPSPPEVFGSLGDAEQTEEVAEENKSLMWTLMKQVRPGMDLSKVVLPTFILEPRSFLEKLADYKYHIDLLDGALEEPDPFKRMKAVVKFYLSGFYKKPKGLKKPYNPILGENFRCYWQHNDNEQTKTFYVAEQVSHHPPISAFYISNRQAGYNMCGTILAKSKFYGNSLSAIMVGTVRVTLLNRGESYFISLPYAHCKGLIVGTLTMELGGQITISCDRTSYRTELEFKLKPFFGGADSMNSLNGKIKLGKETMADIEGHWDGEIYITDRQTRETELLWQPTTDTIKQRLKRYEVPIEEQGEFESQRLWRHVTEAILNQDQIAATEQKKVIEDAQRKRAKHIKDTNQYHQPRLFEFEPTNGQWLYKHADYRPWDLKNDVRFTESNSIIHTISRHKTPLVRAASLSSVFTSPVGDEDALPPMESSEGEDGDILRMLAPRSLSETRRTKKRRSDTHINKTVLEECLKPLVQTINKMNTSITSIQYKMDQQNRNFSSIGTGNWLVICAIIFIVHTLVLTYLLRR